MGTCTYNPATQAINITLATPSDEGVVAVETAADDLDAESAPGAILFIPTGRSRTTSTRTLNSAQCGSATNTNTTSIVVLGSPNGDEFFAIDNLDGAEFNTAITWAVDMGGNTVGGTDEFEIDAADQTSGGDNIVLTSSTFTLNGGGGPLLGVETIQVFGGDGDDVVDGSAVGAGTTLFLEGDAGDDWLAPGLAAPQTVAATPIGDEVFGGAGTDTLSYGTRTDSTVIDNRPGLAGHDANGDCDVLDIGDEADVLDDVFEILQTGSGNDCLIGDGGGVDETFIPGDGDDDITGDAADDDVIDWSSSSAAMSIDPANGTATGQGTDTYTDVFNFVGSAFDDVLLWDGTTDGFVGGDGVDTVDATAAVTGQVINLETLDNLGGLEVDTLENALGGSGNDTLTGNDLRNNLVGNDGDDTLNGAAGNDSLEGGLGNDTFFGGVGADRVSFAASANGVTADLSLGFASGEGDDAFGLDVEILVGSDHNDTFTGGGGATTRNFLFLGGKGNDSLTGSGSNDTLRGGGGNDITRGASGDDTMFGGKGNDRMFGGAGTDIGKGGPGDDVCKGVEIAKSCGSQRQPGSYGPGCARRSPRLAPHSITHRTGPAPERGPVLFVRNGRPRTDRSGIQSQAAELL